MVARHTGVESVDDGESRSSYVTKDPYYKSNPILKEMFNQLFNDHFLEFYDYLKNCKGSLMELLKVRVIEHNIVAHKQSLICYATDRDQYNKIYDHFSTLNRSNIPHFIVTSDRTMKYSKMITMKKEKLLHLL